MQMNMPATLIRAAFQYASKEKMVLQDRLLMPLALHYFL